MVTFDIHNYEEKFQQVTQQVLRSEISQRNKISSWATVMHASSSRPAGKYA
jgi:hypothetical protein